MCLELSSNDLLDSPIECGPVITVNRLAIGEDFELIKEQIVTSLPSISDDVLISRVKWTKINGIMYKINGHDNTDTCNIVNNAQMAEPTVCFGLIQILNTNIVFFLTRIYKSCTIIMHHYHAYIIQETCEQLLVQQKLLLDLTVLHSRYVNHDL